jgi:crotonobetainyl-CoA:carnitine CoA-transferase CaiB-like acyl-CoA transferase
LRSGGRFAIALGCDSQHLCRHAASDLRPTPRCAARGEQAFWKQFGAALPEPTKAPTIGERSDEVLGKLLGYDAQRIAKLKASGALGGVSPGEP